MRECVKASLTVVAAHAGGTYAAKARIGVDDVQYGVVYASAAEGAGVEDSLLRLSILREEIECQRVWGVI